MKNANSPATLNAATMGTARMSGVVRKAPSRSDNTVVGSMAPAESSKVEEAGAASKRGEVALMPNDEGETED